MSDLLPCPFCSEKPMKAKYHEHPHEYVHCKKCGLWIHSESLWNQRATSPAQSDWLNKWGRWLDRAAQLDAEYEHVAGGRAFSFSYHPGVGWGWFSTHCRTSAVIKAGAIVVHSRAAAKALAAEMQEAGV